MKTPRSRGETDLLTCIGIFMITVVHRVENREKPLKNLKILLNIAITVKFFIVTSSSGPTDPQTRNGFEIKLVPGTENLVPNMKVNLKNRIYLRHECSGISGNARLVH